MRFLSAEGCMEMINYYTLQRINKKAIELFSGDEAKANQWMYHSNEEFGGHSPYDYCNTKKGSKTVENHLDHQLYLQKIELESSDNQTKN
jgi:uncharacterized protein (DUF2384 family)